ncbi:hypothetical protein L1887_47863 [Cichorium endivia]|nr:hypothetical protein L1887_47863 [Cichorium endivia]
MSSAGSREESKERSASASSSRSATPGPSVPPARRRSQSFDTTDSESDADSEPEPGPLPPAARSQSPDDSDDDSDVGPPPPPASTDDSKGATSADRSDSRSAKRAQDDRDEAARPPPQKRQKPAVLPHESTYLGNLPSADRYFKSLMHRDTVNSVTVTPRSNFVITTSVDGWVKFWKKSSLAPPPTSAGSKPSEGSGSASNIFSGSSVVESVKQYRAHLAPIIAWSCSADGASYATLDAESNVKVFDVDNFDLINMIKLPYKARTLAWVHRPGSARTLLAISDEESCKIRIYDARSSPSSISNGDGEDASAQDELSQRPNSSAAHQPIFTASNVHRSPVHLLAFNAQLNVVVSCDVTGFVEYWVPEETCPPPSPLKVPGVFQLKSTTDLFEFKKTKTVPTTLTFSRDGEKFAIFSAVDRKIRVFDFRTAKIARRYDESLEALQALQARPAPSSSAQAPDQANEDDDSTPASQQEINFKLDQMEFGRRYALEREITASSAAGPLSGVANASSVSMWNVVFDESGHFIIYASLLGIKFVNLVTDRVVRLLGKDESVRFMHLALFQGAPDRKVSSLAAAASENPLLAKQGLADPTLFATAFGRARFYMFTRVDPDALGNSGEASGGDRDVFNEKPTREEQTIAAATSLGNNRSRNAAGASASVGVKHSTATLHTTLGDIHITLYADLVPKTCNNFIGLAKKGYYNDVIFHRIIKKFMVQTGDPLGDGTGGESLWGGNFEDEFHPSLNHSKPFTLSMANAGPNTNGSQFFITTVPTPWLDRKHTVFGKVSAGMDVVKRIEDAKVDKNDKPRQDIRIINISLR